MVERGFRSYRIQYVLQHDIGRSIRQDEFDCSEQSVLHGQQRADRPRLLLRGYRAEFV